MGSLIRQGRNVSCYITVTKAKEHDGYRELCIEPSRYQPEAEDNAQRRYGQ
jgi:hypothetical protein